MTIYLEDMGEVNFPLSRKNKLRNWQHLLRIL